MTRKEIEIELTYYKERKKELKRELKRIKKNISTLKVDLAEIEKMDKDRVKIIGNPQLNTLLYTHVDDVVSILNHHGFFFKDINVRVDSQYYTQIVFKRGIDTYALKVVEDNLIIERARVDFTGYILDSQVLFKSEEEKMNQLLNELNDNICNWEGHVPEIGDAVCSVFLKTLK